MNYLVDIGEIVSSIDYRREAGRPFSTAWAAGIIRFKAGGTTKLTKVCYILTKIDFSSTAIYTFFINCLCL